ncbi:hypothetical protein WOLCODRAFT_82084, partial [Wolfiporia cocos MD-104 SS10]
RCDGSRPVCRECLRSQAQSDCIYADGPQLAAVENLEQQITLLEARIADIEGSDSFSIPLHDPYQQYRQMQAQQSTAQSANKRRHFPPQTLQTLTREFSQRAPEMGFFLHVPRFLQRITNTPPAGHPHDILVLLSAIYLLGAHVSSDPQLQALQPEFLSRALESLPLALINSHSTAAIYALQAEILLAYYLFANNRRLEGIVHANAAGTIALACRLHVQHSSRNVDTIRLSHGTQYSLSPPSDSIEAGERINAFWAAFAMDKSWSATLGFRSVFPDEETNDTHIDTPWPLDISSYRGRVCSCAVSTSLNTVRTFLRDPWYSAMGQSILALQSQAAALLQNSTKLAAEYAQGNQGIAPSNFEQAGATIDGYVQRLPRIGRINRTQRNVVRRLLVIHVLCHCAMINLLRPLSQPHNMQRSLTAAKSAITALREAQADTIRHVDPIMGMLLTIVTDCLRRSTNLAEVRSEASTSSSAHQSRNPVAEALEYVLSVLEAWGRTSSLIGACTLYRMLILAH